MANTSSLPKIVAVYGTLRRGDYANSFLEGCEYLGVDYVAGKLYNLGAYPGALFSNDSRKTNNNITVDLYALPSGASQAKEVLATLDRYEGYDSKQRKDSLYLRKILKTHGGKTVWSYEYNAREIPEERLIESGDWHNIEGTEERNEQPAAS